MRKYGFKEARRQLEYHEKDANGVDLQGTGQFAVQCKALNTTPNIPQVFTEIKQHTIEHIPMVVFKVDGKGIYAAFKWEDALLLTSAFHAWSSGHTKESPI